MMRQNQSNQKNFIQICVIALSIIGLLTCIAVLFPQVRHAILEFVEQSRNKKIFEYHAWFNAFISYAIGGICFILFIDYCMLTNSGRSLVRKVDCEIRDCLSEIDFRSLIKPTVIMFGIYLLGILTIIRANYLYMDDIGRAVEGYRIWYPWSRYVAEVATIFMHADTNLTDISPLTQLLAVLILSISSVLLVYLLGNKKITTIRLLASMPLGLSPYFLECVSFKFDAPYMAFSILICIVPFLFINRKKAFVFCSIVSLLLMCMTYQAASGVYGMIVLALGFQYWNSRAKLTKEIFSFMGIAVFAFCAAMLIFRFFLMKHPDADIDTSGSIHPVSQIVSGTLNRIMAYATVINQDFGITWKIGIALVCILFIAKSIQVSAHKKISSFLVSTVVIGLSFIASYGVYSLLQIDTFPPRMMYGFGVFLAIVCIYVVSDYKKMAIVAVLALHWCLFVFAFSYGNALADQERYAKFRIGILLHDLSSLYPEKIEDHIQIQLENSIDHAPSIKNISKHYPIIERLIHRRLGADFYWDYMYYLTHFNFIPAEPVNGLATDFKQSDLPVVLDSYYHTIQSDGSRILVVLKH